MIEMEENVSLVKKHQSKFSKKIKQVTKQVKVSEDSEQDVTKKRRKPKRGVVYIGHIPHGFYENEMEAYFKQFGKVTNVRLCRSAKTGESKGYAFVEFDNPQVAKIAAETMDNYLMFNKRLEAKVVPAKGAKVLRQYKAQAWSKKSYPLKEARKKANMKKNANIDKATHLAKCRRLLDNVNKNLKKLKDVGINYSFQATDIPAELNKVTPKLKPKEKDPESFTNVKDKKQIKLVKKSSMTKKIAKKDVQKKKLGRKAVTKVRVTKKK